MSNISIKQLETFRTVMRSGSVTVAAKTLCRTQPAISAMLVSLEKELGFALFERHKGRLIPNPEAYFLLEETDAILERLSRSTQLMAEVKNLTRGKLRIACMPAAALFFMPHVIAEFVKDRPEVEVSMMMRSSTMVQDWVASQQYDIGYSELPKDRDSFHVEPIHLEGVCALHKDHPLALKEVITPKDLDNEPLAALYTRHSASEHVRMLFEECGATYRPRFELQNYISGFEFVEQKLCACICDPISAASYKLYKSGQGNVVFRPFTPAVLFDHAILTPAHKPMSQLAKVFAESIRGGVKQFVSM
ncbi:LysR family transcriptional regulator [Vibrio diabolicus]|uniref:LysR family transcriptional regulator n=1 Tax=Vibrio diabolicus TaxID=50719 RepID=UPI003D7E4FA7